MKEEDVVKRIKLIHNSFSYLLDECDKICYNSSLSKRIAGLEPNNKAAIINHLIYFARAKSAI